MMSLTQQQEHFAQLIAIPGPKPLTQSAAYRLAYNVNPDGDPATTWEDASRLVANPTVAARIAQLRASVDAEAVAERAWNRNRLVSELEINSTQARAAKQFAPSNRALELIGKATGLLADQPVAVTPLGTGNSLAALSVEELRQMIQQRERFLALLEAGKVVEQAPVAPKLEPAPDGPE